MSRHKILVVAVIVLVSLGGWAMLHENDVAVKDDTAATAPGAAGMIGVTGDPNDPDAAKNAAVPATSTSSEGLVEQPSPGSAGGVMVDLQGRFKQAATATVGDSDSVVVECSPDSAGGGGR